MRILRQSSAGLAGMIVIVNHNIGNATGCVLVLAENHEKRQQSLNQFIDMFQEMSILEDVLQLQNEVKETV